MQRIEGYTVWVCEIGSAGNIAGTHHVSYHVGTVEEAKALALNETAIDWYSENSSDVLSGLHILGVAKGDVEVIEWDELT